MDEQDIQTNVASEIESCLLFDRNDAITSNERLNTDSIIVKFK